MEDLNNLIKFEVNKKYRDVIKKRIQIDNKLEEISTSLETDKTNESLLKLRKILKSEKLELCEKETKLYEVLNKL